MGVIKRSLFGSAQHAHMIQDTASETTETVSVASVQQVRVPRCRRRRRVRVDASDVYDDEVEEHAGRLGARQARRLANVQFLLNLADKFGKADDKVGPYESSSLFADLFKDREKMVFWQEFSSLSEDRQLRLLDKFATAHSTSPSLGKIEEDADETQAEADTTASKLQRESDADASDYGFELVARPATEGSPNPCASTSGTSVRFCDCETCFARVHTRFRTLLRRRDAPRGLLDNLEQQLTTFFTDAPDAICVLSLSSAYERLCVHIVSEWLGLQAQSMDGDMRTPLSRCARRNKAARCTVVENANAHFVPPEKRLVCYLDDRDAKRIGAVRVEG